jgi:hypothetical protein
VRFRPAYPGRNSLGPWRNLRQCRMHSQEADASGKHFLLGPTFSMYLPSFRSLFISAMLSMSCPMALLITLEFPIDNIFDASVWSFHISSFVTGIRS